VNSSKFRKPQIKFFTQSHSFGTFCTKITYSDCYRCSKNVRNLQVTAKSKIMNDAAPQSNREDMVTIQFCHPLIHGGPFGHQVQKSSRSTTRPKERKRYGSCP
jgi:hypothetical protein